MGGLINDERKGTVIDSHHSQIVYFIAPRTVNYLSLLILEEMVGLARIHIVAEVNLGAVLVVI